MEQKQTQIEEKQEEVQANRAHLNLKKAEQIKARRLESVITECD